MRAETPQLEQAPIAHRLEIVEHLLSWCMCELELLNSALVESTISEAEYRRRVEAGEIDPEPALSSEELRDLVVLATAAVDTADAVIRAARAFQTRALGDFYNQEGVDPKYWDRVTRFYVNRVLAELPDGPEILEEETQGVVGKMSVGAAAERRQHELEGRES